ncbi:MAG: restriction endonuclease subunit S [Cyanobium sp. ELA712]
MIPSKYPLNWSTQKVKYVAALKSGDAITSEDISETGDYPVFGGNGLRGYTSSYNCDGDHPLIGRQGALCGNINFASGRFWASEHAVVVTPKNKHHSRWLRDVLETMDLNQYSQSAAQPGISVEVIENLTIPVPPRAEQVAISSYLDRERSRIDRLIAEKERMLALLEEKRSALVSRVVTRGLDPNAPLKPSGLEWLGEIPEHWELRRTKFVSSRLDQGSSPVASNTPAASGELGVLKLSAVSKGRFRREENKALREIDEEEQLLALRKGDILITRGNTPELIADVAYVSEDEPSLLLPDLIYRLRIQEKEILAEYLTAFLTTAAARVQIRRDARGSSGSMVKVSQDHVLDWLTPLPPLFEQEEIMNLLRSADEGFQSVEREVSSSLTLLSERRAALINAAVTGQIPLEEMK